MKSEINLLKFIYLIGISSHQFVECKLPLNLQVQSLWFFNTREVKLSLSENVWLEIDKILIFWQKSRKPTGEIRNCVSQLEELYMAKFSKKTYNVATTMFVESCELFHQVDPPNEQEHSSMMNL